MLARKACASSGVVKGEETGNNSHWQARKSENKVQKGQNAAIDFSLTVLHFVSSLCCEMLLTELI